MPEIHCGHCEAVLFAETYEDAWQAFWDHAADVHGKPRLGPGGVQ